MSADEEAPPDSGPRLAGSVLDAIPDVRDGLTRKERVVLFVLSELMKERPGRMVPTAMLYGRVVELVDMSERELSHILSRLGAMQQRRD